MRKASWLALFLLGRALHAASGDGGQAAAYLQMGVGAREQGMGGIATLSPVDPYAFYYNPALLAGIEHTTLGSQAAFLSDERSMDYLSLAVPTEFNSRRFYYGASFTWFRLNQPIEFRSTDTPDPDSTAYDSQYAAQFSAASWLAGGRVAVGLSFRLLNESLGGSTATGINGDLGALFRASSWLDVGAVFEDVAGRMSWSTGYADSFPLVFRGTAMAHFFDKSLDADFEFEKSSSQDLRLRGGVEWWTADDSVALRAGLNGLQWSTGLGYRFEPWGELVELDYSIAADPIEANALAQRLSLTINFAAASPAKNPS